MEGGIQPVPWTPRDTFLRLLAALAVAIIIPPLLVAPFDPKLKSDAALLVAQAIFDGILLVFAIGTASGWRFGDWREAVERLGMRRFAPNGLLLAFGVLIAYYIAAGLFAAYVLKPDQQDI